MAQPLCPQVQEMPPRAAMSRSSERTSYMITSSTKVSLWPSFRFWTVSSRSSRAAATRRGSPM